MIDSEINSLKDLQELRSAPSLDKTQEEMLMQELSKYIEEADWFTIGIMAESSNVAVDALKQMERRFNWSTMKIATKPKESGPVFLKANQRTGDVYLRIEYGLGEGILIGCQHNDDSKDTFTLGPFPLDFFKMKD